MNVFHIHMLCTKYIYNVILRQMKIEIKINVFSWVNTDYLILSLSTMSNVHSYDYVMNEMAFISILCTTHYKKKTTTIKDNGGKKYDVYCSRKSRKDVKS